MKTKKKKAFTLIELLVVLAVMGLMMGVVGFSLLSGGGAELGSSQRNLLGLLQQARTKAAASGLATRLVVHAGESDEEKFHRYMEILVQDPNATDSWMVYNEGIYLEEGIYFVPEDYSLSSRPSDWRSDAYCLWSHDNISKFELKDSFKGMREEGQGTTFKYIQFDNSGNLVCPPCPPGNLPESPLLVIAKGQPNPADPSTPLKFNDSNSIAGILMRRFGGIAVLEIGDFSEP